ILAKETAQQQQPGFASYFINAAATIFCLRCVQHRMGSGLISNRGQEIRAPSRKTIVLSLFREASSIRSVCPDAFRLTRMGNRNRMRSVLRRIISEAASARRRHGQVNRRKTAPTCPRERDSD